MSWDAPTDGARPPSLPDAPSLPDTPPPPETPSLSDTPSLPDTPSPADTPPPPETPSLPRLPAQTTPVPPRPTADVLGDVAPIAPTVLNIAESMRAEDSATEVATPTPNWKKRKKSKLRRLTTALITMVVLGALVAGAVFGYQAMNPPEEPTPPVPLREQSDTIFGRTGDLVDGINEGMPDQELLDQVLGEDLPNDALNDGLEPDRD